MKTFEVVVHFGGAVKYKITAETKEQADELAMEKFAEEDAETLADQIVDVEYDSWEMKGKDN